MKLRRSLLNVAPAIFAALFLSVIIPSLLASRSDDAASAYAGPQAVSASVSRVGFGLSIATEPQVTLDVSPKPAGAMTVVSSIVSPATTAPNGYTLYLQMTGDNASTNALINSVDDNVTITSSGTYASPVALTEGKWGYAIPGNSDSLLDTNHFDDTYTTMESATPTGSVFAAVPVYPGDAEKIAETNEPGGVDLTVYYGVNASYNTVSGSYSNKILYTALADSGSTPTMIVSPERIAGSGNIPLQLMTSLYTTKEDVDFSGYMLTPEQYAAVQAGTLDVTTLTSQKLSSCTRDTSQEALTLSCRSVSLDHAGPTIIYLDIPTYDVHYADQIMLAGTEEFYTISTMQEMTPMVCKSVPTPAANADYAPTTYLTDNRDNKVYEVKKLADGNCWMTQNLAISGTTIDYTDSNLPGGASFTVPASGENSFCTTSNTTECDGRANVIDAGNTDHPEYGTYYNWYAATAGYGTYSTTSGNVSYSVCPKGWRLPTGGTSGAFQGLVNAGYNTSALMQSEAGPNFALSGYRDGSNTDQQGTGGVYWSSTPTATSGRAYNLYLTDTALYPTGSYYGYRGYSVRCIADSFWNIADMQDMTSDVCEAATTPLATATAADTDGSHDGQTSYVPQRTLSDIRDGNSYTIRKLADGNCWMTENLRLKFAAGDVLTPADTNVSKNTTVTLATQPANQPSTDYYKWGYPANLTNEQIIAYGTVNTWLSRESGMKESQTSSGNLTGEDQDFGVYYNNYAISGGTMLFDSPINTDYRNDICPKGWMIPNNWDSSGKSFVRLIVSTYHVITAAENSATEISQERYNARAPMLHNFPLSLPLSGYVSPQNGVTGFQGVRAVWRNNRSAGGIGQGFLVFRVLSGAPFDISTSRGNSYNVGTPVRCVNK